MTKHEPQHILVTGGGGFLGKAIARRLVERGDRVSSLSRGFYDELAAIGVQQIRGNLADAPTVLDACNGKDVVFHVAAKPPPWGKYADYYRSNVTGTENVISGCHRKGVTRLVYTSTPSVVFDGRDMEGIDESVPYPGRYPAFYPETKAMAERMVIRAAGDRLRTVALRPHQIWGPGDPHFAPRPIARARKLKRTGTGKNRGDTTYIDNAVDAHIAAADRLADRPGISGKVYFLSDDDPVPAWEMIDRILACAGRPKIRGQVSHRTARSAGAFLEFIYRFFHLPGEPPMTRFVADALATAHWFDIGAAKKDLGYRPAVSIEEGLERLAVWLKDKGPA